MKCILCSSENVFPLEFSRPSKREFFRCSRCDLIFVPEKYHLGPDEEVARYRMHRNTLSNEGYVGMFLEKIDIMQKYCHEIKKILDYGCGPSPVLAELLMREGYSCDVYDPYFFPVFSEGPYDIVISTEVFEHLRDISKELHMIRKLIKPGGYLAVMTSLHDNIRDFQNWWYASDPTHISFFSARTFEWIAKEHGFMIVYADKKNFVIMFKRKSIPIAFLPTC